jgi:uncharacterized membrane protein
VEEAATTQAEPVRRLSPGAPGCFLVLSLVSGISITFVTPPFQVPDEPAHLYRSYAVSEGMLGARTTPQGTGAMLPASLRELVAVASGVAAHPEQRFVVLLVVAATVLLIEISLYLLWTPVGAAAIEGVQGRYFLPVAAAAVWLMPWRRLAAAFDPRMVGALAALVAGLSLTIAMVAVVERYYW